RLYLAVYRCRVDFRRPPSAAVSSCIRDRAAASDAGAAEGSFPWASRAAAAREAAERRRAALWACCDNARSDADRRLSRLSAPSTARDRLRDGFLRRRPFARARLAGLFVLVFPRLGG